MFRLDRSRTAGPLLAWKVRIFVVAGALAMAGIYLEEPWFTGAAILLLLVAALLRFVSGTREGEDGPDEDSPET